MGVFGEWIRRVRYLLRRSREDEALRREMEDHRARLADPRTFGNTVRLREDARDVWGWAWLDDLVRDVRFAWRTLVRSPGFTIVSIASLGLATGATTAIFSIVDGVLLRPLPLDDPDRLVQVHGRNWREDRGGAPDPLTGPVVAQELDAYEQQSRSFEGFAAYAVNTRHLAGASGVERLTAVIADRSFFTVLGVEPILGRTFGTGDSLDVAVISARLWQQRFDGDPSLPGKTIVLNDRPVTVLGVMPEDFQFPYRAASLLPGALPESRTDVWVPIERRGRLSAVGRLERGVSIEAAASELRLIAARLEQQHEGTRVRVGVRVVPLADAVLGPVRRSLWMLFAAAGLVLAAACANVANLLLARLTVRTREVVTRAALGADRGRLVRQFLAESLLLACAGAVAGVAVARWGTDLLVAVGSARIPRAHEIALDWRAFAFLLGACAATAMLFGLAPALSASKVDVHTATKDSGGHATVAGRYGRIRDALVVIEVALAFVLALGAAVVMQELLRLQRIPSGMVTDNVLTLHLTPRASPQDYYAIEARVAQLPSVHAAGLTQLLPLQNWGWNADFAIRGRAPEGRPIAGLRYVTPGYFRALGIPLVRGRGFAASDTADAPGVILVNEALARQYFPGEDPVGRVLDRGTIVGVAGDVRQIRLDLPAEPEIYYPAAQNVTMASDIGMSLIVRSVVAPESLTDAIRAAVREVNPALAIFNVRTLERVVGDSLWELHLYRWLIGLFAGLALLIAAIGLYGIISYNVTSRMREFAVRLALGSDPAALSRLVLSRAIRLAAAGLVAGVLIAVAASPIISSMIAGADTGAAIYAAVGAALLTVALAACAIPAWRVAGVNPASALRHE